MTSGRQQPRSCMQITCPRNQCLHPPHCCPANWLPAQGTSDSATPAARERHSTAAARGPVCKVGAATGVGGRGAQVIVQRGCCNGAWRERAASQAQSVCCNEIAGQRRKSLHKVGAVTGVAGQRFKSLCKVCAAMGSQGRGASHCTKWVLQRDPGEGAQVINKGRVEAEPSRPIQAVAVVPSSSLPHPLPPSVHCTRSRNRYDETPVFLSISEAAPAPAALAGAAAAAAAVPPQRRSIPGATPPGSDGASQRTVRTGSGGLRAPSATPEGVKGSSVAATADKGGSDGNVTLREGPEGVGEVGAATRGTAADAIGEEAAAAGEEGGKLKEGKKGSRSKA